MSIETRSNSALFKRAEQLKRWEKSETNLEPTTPSTRERKIKFSPGCVFLAACKAGDKEEILRLLKKGADIDTSDVDGLSALHQACIDDNLDLVEFLVKHGADVNKGDNEGWTPLHATSSCGFISIAKFLIENGADVAAVNNDSELPMDVAESSTMEDMLQKLIEDRGIDAENARTEEERLMLNDAKAWLANGSIQEKIHAKTGATALHVAAAKGYLKVMDLLIKAGAEIDAQDLDGWTALHAGAHWCQKEACKLLVENLCDMDIKNCVGQTSFDVADNEMIEFLDDLRKKQAVIPNKDNIINRRKNNQKKVPPQGAFLDNAETKKNTINDVAPSQPKVPEVQQVELQIKPEPPQNQSTVDTDDDIDTLSSETSCTESSDVSDDESDVSDEDSDLEKKYRANERLPSTTEVNKTVPNTPAPSIPPKTPTGEGDDSGVPVWRRPGSFRSRLTDSSKPLALKINEKESPTKAYAPPAASPAKNETSQEVRLRRTQSFEADEKFYQRYLELRAKIASNCYPSASSTPPTRSASLKEKHFTSVFERRAAAAQSRDDDTTKGTGLAATTSTPTTGTATSTVTNSSPTSTSPQNNTVRSSAPVTPSTPTTPGGSKLSPANIFKNFFKSFVPPVRDEESETQRKAHAKRVRETRRSTQGVTLEEIKSAEQLVKKKQQQQLQAATQQLTNSEPGDEVVVNVRAVPAAAPPSPSSQTTSSTASVVNSLTSPVEPAAVDREQQENGTLERTTGGYLSERRPSWRLKVDNSNKFMLEDARKANEGHTAAPSETVVRKTAIATPVTETGDTTVTLPLRKRTEDKEQEKDSDSRTAQATQAAIQRRRRPKRRSTGVVHVDMDEIDPDRQGDSSGGGGSGDTDDSLSINNSESGGEQSEVSSRLNSVSVGDSAKKPEATENGEIDYKKLYEESQRDNERLREKLRNTEADLAEARTLADSNPSQTRNSLTELEKRERRALERKLSEMEEELKQLQKLKSDNERLRAENRALTRVVSKLTASQNK